MAAQKVASLACAMLTLSVGAAAAADLPSRKGPPVYIAPAFTWTGFYIGGTHGYGGGDPGADALSLGGRSGGFFVGGQIGYDYQFSNNVVLGVAADLNWSGIKYQTLNNAYALAAAASSLGQNVDSRYYLNWFGTVRGRLGYAYGRLLPYLTGGFAYGSMSVRNLDGFADTTGAYNYGAAAASGLRGGFTVGAGVEYAVSDGLTLFSEYSYLELGGLTGPLARSVNAGTGVGRFSTTSFGTHLLRAGVNWRPGSLSHAASVLSDPAAAIGALFAMYAEAPTVNWTGFYAGLNGGYGGGTWSAYSQFLDTTLNQSTYVNTSSRSSGFIVGGQAGYNRQYGHWVVGVETDLQWSDVQALAWQSSGLASTTSFSSLGPISTGRTSLDWFGTTRLRVGWASGRTLPYLTAGVAYGEFSSKSPQALGWNGGQFDFVNAGISKTSVGWTVGSGLDYALTDTISLRSEYLYTHLEGLSGTSTEIYRAFANGPAAVVASTVVGKLSTYPLGTHAFRAGVNMKFSGP
jgi:outer membrane immunogenic protein